MFVVCEKLRLLQAELKNLNTKEFNDISNRATAIRHHLDLVQSDLGHDPTNIVKQAQERDLCKQYLVLAKAEESFAKQKSRIQWIKLGDQCTSYFFKVINSNRNRNRINCLALPNDSITYDPAEIKTTFIEYYTTLLGTAHPSEFSAHDRVNQIRHSKEYYDL